MEHYIGVRKGKEWVRERVGQAHFKTQRLLGIYRILAQFCDSSEATKRHIVTNL